MGKRVAVAVRVQSTIEQVWELWNKSEHINQWFFSPAPNKTSMIMVNFVVNGEFRYRSFINDVPSIEIGGLYLMIVPKRFIAYLLDDQRVASVSFEVFDDIVLIQEAFEVSNSEDFVNEQQICQAVLNRFKDYVDHFGQ